MEVLYSQGDNFYIRESANVAGFRSPYVRMFGPQGTYERRQCFFPLTLRRYSVVGQ